MLYLFELFKNDQLNQKKMLRFDDERPIFNCYINFKKKTMVH